MVAKRVRRSIAAAGAVAFSIVALSGCVAAPQPLPPGAVVLSQQCFAGFYTCVVPLNPQGTPCSCPGLGAPSFGTIR